MFVLRQRRMYKKNCMNSITCELYIYNYRMDLEEVQKCEYSLKILRV